MVKELTKGSYKIKYHANGVDKEPIEIDFTPPFRCAVYIIWSLYTVFYSVDIFILLTCIFNCYRRIDMIEGLEQIAGLSIPKDLSSNEANQYLKDACSKFEIKCPPPETTARLLDKVISFLVFPFLIFLLCKR